MSTDEWIAPGSDPGATGAPSATPDPAPAPGVWPSPPPPPPPPPSVRRGARGDGPSWSSWGSSPCAPWWSASWRRRRATGRTTRTAAGPRPARSTSRARSRRSSRSSTPIASSRSPRRRRGSPSRPGVTSPGWATRSFRVTPSGARRSMASWRRCPGRSSSRRSTPTSWARRSSPTSTSSRSRPPPASTTSPSSPLTCWPRSRRRRTPNSAVRPSRWRSPPATRYVPSSGWGRSTSCSSTSSTNRRSGRSR